MFPAYVHAAAAAPSSAGSLLSNFATWIVGLGQEVNVQAVMQYVLPSLFSGDWVGVITALVTHAKDIFPSAPDLAALQAQIQGLPFPHFA